MKWQKLYLAPAYSAAAKPAPRWQGAGWYRFQDLLTSSSTTTVRGFLTTPSIKMVAEWVNALLQAQPETRSYTLSPSVLSLVMPSRDCMYRFTQKHEKYFCFVSTLDLTIALRAFPIADSGSVSDPMDGISTATLGGGFNHLNYNKSRPCIALAKRGLHSINFGQNSGVKPLLWPYLRLKECQEPPMLLL